MAETELNVNYTSSPIVASDINRRLGPGQRLPDTIKVKPAGTGPCRLHELTHRAGHTIMLLEGSGARGSEIAERLAALREFATDSRLFLSTNGV